MNKTTKNIILIVLLIVLIVSSYFTCEFIKKSNYPKFEYNNIYELDDIQERSIPSIRKKSNKNNNETIELNETKETNETNGTSETNNKKARLNKKYNQKRSMMGRKYRRSMPTREVPVVKEREVKNIYYILFSLENILIGVVATYLVIFNLKKEDKKNK